MWLSWRSIRHSSLTRDESPKLLAYRLHCMCQHVHSAAFGNLQRPAGRIVFEDCAVSRLLWVAKAMQTRWRICLIASGSSTTTATACGARHAADWRQGSGLAHSSQARPFGCSQLQVRHSLHGSIFLSLHTTRWCLWCCWRLTSAAEAVSDALA